MTYSLVVHRLALKDLHEAHDRVARRAPLAAARWLNRFQQSLQTLEYDPQRCVFARENAKVDVDLREFLFGKRPYVFRVIFTIDSDKVRILRIRRAQRRFLTQQEIEEAIGPEE